MSRPDDWYVLDLGADPTPGDPYQVRLLARTFLGLAENAFAAATDVRRLTGDQGVVDWAGEAGAAFADAVGELPGQLDKLDASYGIAGRALRVYAADLEAAQTQADSALVRGRELWLRRASAERQVGLVTHADPDVWTVPDVRTDSDVSAVLDTQADLDAERRLALAARQLREQAARTCRSEIERASDAGIHNRSFWGAVTDLAGELWDRAVAVAKVAVVVASLAAVVVGGPLAWVAVAAALVVLADTLDRYARGDASLWDVGLALVQCIPCTTGLTTVAGLARGVRAAATGLRGGIVAGAEVGQRALTAGASRLASLAASVRSGADAGAGAAARAGAARAGRRAMADRREHELEDVADVVFGPRGTRIGADREIVAVADHVRPLEGYHDVVLHGTADDFVPLGLAWPVDPSQVAQAIRANPYYASGTPVRAISCWTGKNGVAGPAQALADHLQVEVLAPTVKAGVPASYGTHDAVLGVGSRVVKPGTVIKLGNGEEVVAEWIRLVPNPRPAN